MADVETNILEHTAEFKALMDSINFTLPGKEGSLGKDVATVAAVGIVDRTVAEGKASDGSPLKPNAPKYAAMKARKYHVHNVGIRTGQMLSLESVKGQVTVDPFEVTMAYGTGTAATRFATQGTLKKNEPTDREKADFFAAGGREFYELTPDIEDLVQDEVEAAIDNLIGGL